MPENQDHNPLDQEELMEQDIDQDEELETGVKGGSVSGQSDDATELEDQNSSDDSDEEIVDSEEYREYGDENF